MFLTSHIEQRNFPRTNKKNEQVEHRNRHERENITILFHHFCCCCSASSFVASVTSAAGWDWGFRFRGKKIDFQAKTSVTSSTKWRPPVRQVESPFIFPRSLLVCICSHPTIAISSSSTEKRRKNQQHQQQKTFPRFRLWLCVFVRECWDESCVFLIIFSSPFRRLLACESYIVNKTRKCSHKLLTFSLSSTGHPTHSRPLLNVIFVVATLLLLLLFADFALAGFLLFPLWTSFTLACLLVCVDFPIKFPSSSLPYLLVFVRIFPLYELSSRKRFLPSSISLRHTTSRARDENWMEIPRSFRPRQEKVSTNTSTWYYRSSIRSHLMHVGGTEHDRCVGRFSPGKWCAHIIRMSTTRTPMRKWCEQNESDDVAKRSGDDAVV